MILSIDIGGTKIAAALIQDGQIVERRQIPMVEHADRFPAALAQLLPGLPAVERVTVAATGFISAGHVHAVNQRIIDSWNGFALRDCLEARFSCPIDLINDAQAATWGEYLAAGTRVGNFLYLTLSTGVGGGMVIDGRLQVGHRGLAGHIGHTSVTVRAIDGDDACGCGRSGCLEMVASGTALARQASYFFGEPLDSRALFERARTDPRAQHILDNAARAVAQAIANSVFLLDVEAVVIGGSVGLAEGMTGRIATALAEGPRLVDIPVTPALLGADSGLLGAAQWAAVSQVGGWYVPVGHHRRASSKSRPA